MNIKKHSKKFLFYEGIVLVITWFVLGCLKARLSIYMIVTIVVYLIFYNIWYGVVEKDE